jgi:predicted  nucleic acid-binding Zn-ribbon protein
MRVRIFTQLQVCDQQLAAYARERDEFLAEFVERDRLRELRDMRRALASTLKQERAHNSDLQWELEEVELRLRELQESERDGPSDPLVARELVLLRERGAQLEEQVLRQLEQIAEVERRLADQEQLVEQRTAAWVEREPTLQKEVERLGQVLEALQIQRASIAGQLQPAALELYDDLQRRHRGTALAPVRHRQCSACRARLPAAVFDLLSAPDPIVRCPRCGRVLYNPEQDQATP